MRRAFQASAEVNAAATEMIAGDVLRVAEACRRHIGRVGGFPLAFIRDLCAADGVSEGAVIALLNRMLPAYSDRHRLVYFCDPGQKSPVLVDCPDTAWALLSIPLPIRTKLRLSDGAYIRPDQLEHWARTGELV